MRNKFIRIISTIILLGGAYAIERFCGLPMWGNLLVYLVPYMLIGYSVLAEAIEGIVHGEVFDENFLMSIATIGALCIGFLPNTEPMFAEAVFVMLFFSLGELFEEIAEGRSRASISQLMDIRPDTANVIRNGKTIIVHPSEIAVGEFILIKPGEKVALDGVIVEGSSSLNTIALTGESLPRDVGVEDSIASGCVNINGVLKVKTTKKFGESTASKILELVENASETKSKSENFISKFAKYYTPIVVVSALVFAFLPPILSGSFANFSTWLVRALTFLVVSCPCALVISVPLTFFGGIGGASRQGILIKGSNIFDTMSQTKTVVFDKTGTLTKGVFEVTAIHPQKCDANHLLHLSAHVERFSTHPIALSLRQAYGKEADDCAVTDVTEIAGEGIKATVNGQIVCVGNTKLMTRINAKWQQCDHVGTIIHVAIDGEYAGHIVISDCTKQDSAQAIKLLHDQGLTTVMLTGDRQEIADKVAKELAIDRYYAELMPTDKVTKIAELLPQGKLAFVGDGINDAPVLARANIGIAMGAMGSDVAIETADVVLMDDKPSKVAKAINIAKRTVAIAYQNIIFAIAVKIGVLLLTAFGLTPMWLAVFADVGVMVLAVLNAVRALRVK